MYIIFLSRLKNGGGGREEKEDYVIKLKFENVSTSMKKYNFKVKLNKVFFY